MALFRVNMANYGCGHIFRGLMAAGVGTELSLPTCLLTFSSILFHPRVVGLHADAGGSSRHIPVLVTNVLVAKCANIFRRSEADTKGLSKPESV